MKFLHSIRASMLLGKAHKLLQAERYAPALEKALQAQRLELDQQFAWLSYLIEGKSRYHLGDSKNALPALHKAREILALKLAEDNASRPLQNIMDDLLAYLDKIQPGVASSTKESGHLQGGR